MRLELPDAQHPLCSFVCTFHAAHPPVLALKGTAGISSPIQFVFEALSHPRAFLWVSLNEDSADRASFHKIVVAYSQLSLPGFSLIQWDLLNPEMGVLQILTPFKEQLILVAEVGGRPVQRVWREKKQEKNMNILCIGLPSAPFSNNQKVIHKFFKHFSTSQKTAFCICFSAFKPEWESIESGEFFPLLPSQVG